MKKILAFIKRIVSCAGSLRLILRIIEAIESILQDDENEEKK